jgi:transposase
MLGPNTRVRVYVCREPVDMRRSFSGLSGVVRSIMSSDPLSGHVFLFFNRSRNYVKMLWWDVTGYSILAKRLTRGTFSRVAKSELSMSELSQLLDLVELDRVKKRRCYEYLPK